MERYQGAEITTAAEAWHSELLQRPNFSDQPYDGEANDDGYEKLIVMPNDEKVNELISRSCGLVVDRMMIQLRPGQKSISDPDVVATYRSSREWWNRFGITKYNHQPFHREITETFVIGSDSPETMVYNFGPELSQANQDSIKDAYAWFDAHGLRPRESSVVVGNHLGLMYDLSSSTSSAMRVSGECANRRNTISINQLTLQDGEMADRFIGSRYQELAEMGVTAADIILTHELAHAFANEHEKQAEDFANRAGWRQNEYTVRVPEHFTNVLRNNRSLKFGRRTVKDIFTIEGLGTDATEMPVTSYGWTNGNEDFAESMVYRRFAPQSLGYVRQTALNVIIDKVSNPVCLRPGPSSIERMPSPIYPRFAPADVLVYRTKTHKEWRNEQVRQKLTDEIFRYLDVYTQLSSQRGRPRGSDY